VAQTNNCFSLWLTPGNLQIPSKNLPPPKDKNAPEPIKPPDPIQCSNDILKLLIAVMELTVKHTHTYKRWKVIWTLLLEKDPGNPQID